VPAPSDLGRYHGSPTVAHAGGTPVYAMVFTSISVKMCNVYRLARVCIQAACTRRASVGSRPKANTKCSAAPNLLQVIPPRATRRETRNARLVCSSWFVASVIRHVRKGRSPETDTIPGLPIFAQWPWKLPIERKFSSVVDGPDGESDGSGRHPAMMLKPQPHQTTAREQFQ